MADQSKYTSKLAGARILITGGSSGIGFGVAEAALEFSAGAVYISGSNQERLDAAVERLKAAYPSKSAAISGIACDLGNAATIDDNINHLLKQIGKVDHIVHSAGDALATTKLGDITMDFMQKAGMTRFFAPLLLAKHAKLQGSFEPLDPKKSFTITTGSVAERPYPDWTVVAAYAGGHHNMARALCLELAPVRANVVSPGPVDTELWKVTGEQRKQLLEGLAQRTITKKVASVSDVAEAYLYVMRDTNVCGAYISTNGGSSVL